MYARCRSQFDFYLSLFHSSDFLHFNRSTRRILRETRQEQIQLRYICVPTECITFHKRVGMLLFLASLTIYDLQIDRTTERVATFYIVSSSSFVFIISIASIFDNYSRVSRNISLLLQTVMKGFLATHSLARSFQSTHSSRGWLIR